MASNSSGVDVLFKGIWQLRCVPLKVTAFVWKLAQNRIPTLDNLVKRNIVQSSENFCKGCGKEVGLATGQGRGGFWLSRPSPFFFGIGK